MDTKRCSRCGQYFAATSDNFSSCRNGTLGLHTYCKACQKQNAYEWRIKNPERYKANWKRAALRVDKEQTRAKRRALKLEAMMAYSNGDPKCAFCGERRIEFLTLDHPNNDGGKLRKEETGASCYGWLRKRGWPGDLRVLCMNCNCGREVSRRNGKSPQAKYGRRLRSEAVLSYSAGDPKCACCGISQLNFLTIDHIHGVPPDHRKTSRRSGLGFHVWLRNNKRPDGFQILCFNCNFSKSAYGSCPHQSEPGYRPNSQSAPDKSFFTYINRSFKHGRCGTAEWLAWQNMLRCCKDPNFRKYYMYGGRGIAVADEWYDFGTFFAALGERPSPRHRLDRKDKKGNFTPDNVQWATPEEQQSNTCKSRRVTANGKTQTVSQWARETGFDPDTILMRLNRGWSDEAAVTIPIGGQTPKRKYYTYKGETKTRTEWARSIRMATSAFFARLDMGLTIEEAIETPVNRKKQKAGRTK